MIKYENNDGHTIRLGIKGNLETIISETAYLPFIVYKSLLEKDEGAAEVFRDFFENNSKDIFIFESMKKEYQQENQENQEKVKALIESLINALDKRREEGNKNA